MTVMRPSWSSFRKAPSPCTKKDMSSAVCRNGSSSAMRCLVAVEQVEPADIQRRHVQLPDRIELRVTALLDSPSGNAPATDTRPLASILFTALDRKPVHLVYSRCRLSPSDHRARAFTARPPPALPVPRPV